MNDRFLEKLQQSGTSLYKLSEQTGIPYTNLNKLKNKKQDINNCSVKDIYLLALFFGCDIIELLNPISYLDSTHGTYRRCKYLWRGTQDNDVLQISKDSAEYQKIAQFNPQTDTRYYCSKIGLTEALIDNYLLEKESESMLNENIYFDA